MRHNLFLILIFALSHSLFAQTGECPEPKEEETSEQRKIYVQKIAKSKSSETTKKLLCFLSEEYEIQKIALDALLNSRNKQALYGVLGAAHVLQTDRWNVAAASLSKSLKKADVPELARQLGSGSEDTRKMAAEILGNIKDPSSISPLSEAIRDSAYEVRCAAIDALAKFKGPAILDTLVQAYPFQKRYATCLENEILQMAKPERLIPYLQHENYEVRKGVVNVLCALQDKSLDHEILSETYDANPEVQTSAVGCLIQKHDSVGVKRAAEMLAGSNEEVYKGIFDSLRHPEGEAERNIYRMALQSPSPNLNYFAAQNLAYASYGDFKEFAPYFLRFLSDSSLGIQGLAVTYYLKNPDSIAASTMLDLLTETRNRFWIDALKYFRETRYDKAVPQIQKHMTSGDDEVRFIATSALRLYSGSNVEQAMRASLLDKDVRVRFEAAKYLQMQGTNFTGNDLHYFKIANRDRAYVDSNWVAIKNQLLADIQSPSKIHYAVSAFMWIGNETVVPELIRIMDFQNGTLIPLTYLNSGHSGLRIAAENWSVIHGYQIQSTSSQVNTLGSWKK